MTLILRHNPSLELNRADYSGSVTVAEIAAMVEYQAANPECLTRDTLNIVTRGADFDTVTFADLDAIFQAYQAMFAQKNLTILRRGAWICESPPAQRHVDYWINTRDLRKGISSTVAQFENYADAGAWLVLAPEQTPVLESGEGFEDLARFEAPPVVRAISR